MSTADINNSYLELQNKILTDKGELYAVFYKNSRREYTKQQCIHLIQQIPSYNRNCRTDGKNISLKAGYGRLSIMDRRQKQFPADKNLALLHHDSAGAIEGINIFSGYKYLKLCTVYSNDQFFSRTRQDADFLKRHLDCIREIDNAEIVSYSPATIQTEFGVASIDKLSTGLKTLLNILYIQENDKMHNQLHMVNIDECGVNMIPHIFRLVNNTNISLYLSCYLDDYPEEYNIYVNGVLITDAMQFDEELEKGGAMEWT